jgi:hypothetical protein
MATKKKKAKKAKSVGQGTKSKKPKTMLKKTKSK